MPGVSSEVLPTGAKNSANHTAAPLVICSINMQILSDGMKPNQIQKEKESARFIAEGYSLRGADLHNPNAVKNSEG